MPISGASWLRCILVTLWCVHVDTTVCFSELAFNVHEENGLAQLILILTNPSSVDIHVRVLNTDGTATGKLDVMNLWGAGMVC